jgi:hypothetical protein
VQLDCYIDKSNEAVFVPDPDGVNKSTLVEQGEVFDFDLEVAPILQVLVGRSLETARIEVVEDYEIQQIEKHRQEYKKLRESELILTQQMEAIRIRKNEESDCRHM